MATETDGCVKFNRSSWHYRVTNYVFPYVLTQKHKTFNLCPYLRMVIAATFSIPFMVIWNQFPERVRDQAVIFQVEFGFLFLVMIFAFGLDIMDEFKETNALPPWLDMIAIGFFGGNFFGIVGVLSILGVTHLIDYIKDRDKPKHKSVGLFKAYVNAKHDKICPCVEFEDEE